MKIVFVPDVLTDLYLLAMDQLVFHALLVVLHVTLMEIANHVQIQIKKSVLVERLVLTAQHNIVLLVSYPMYVYNMLTVPTQDNSLMLLVLNAMNVILMVKVFVISVVIQMSVNNVKLDSVQAVMDQLVLLAISKTVLNAKLMVNALLVEEP